MRGSIATRQYIGEATVESYHYTADGQLAEKTDRNGTRTVYTYDGFGRLVLEQAGTDQKTYTYDKAGNLLTATDGGVEITRTYDAEGRVTSKTVDGIGTTVYTYDLNPAGGEVSEKSTAPDGITAETLYDKVGRVSLISSSDGTWVTESYNRNGSRKATGYGDGSGQEYQYDAAGRVTALVHRDKDGKETERYAYTYDANGNLTCESSSRGAIYYTYDALNRLTSVTEPEGRVTEYTYDASGNRATKTERHGDVAVRTVYTYDAVNLLVRQQGDDGTVVVYTYDANGNLLAEDTAGETKDTGDKLAAEEITVPDGEGDVIPSGDEQGTAMSAVATGSLTVDALLPAFLPDKTETVTGSAIDTEDTVFFTAALETVSGSAIRLYTYDNFNRLTAYQSGDTLAAYTYNAEDYRITKQVVSPDKETFTRYFYEGSHVTLEADAVGNITAHNTYSINLASRTVGGEGYYYFYNAHGDVVKLAGIRSGEEITYRYDAFDTLIEANGEADNSITYAGYQYDAESGLYYLNARYYDSTTARFLTEDTYAGQANDPLSLNRYTYCANNPLRYTDPSGHFFAAIFKFAKVAGRLVLYFAGGAAVSGGLEYVSQKYIEERDEINVKAIAYEGIFGGATSLIGGIGTMRKAQKVAKAVKAAKATKVAKTAKGVAKGIAKTGLKEGALGIVEDFGYQVIADEKSLDELDYGQLLKSGVTSAMMSMLGEAADKLQVPGEQFGFGNKKRSKQTTGLIADTADSIPSPNPKANTSPNTSGNTHKNTGNSTGKKNSSATAKKPTAKPNSSQGFSQKGYNPQKGERTLKGYVKDNAEPEIVLNTKSADFNNANGQTGGGFKRFGKKSHGGLSPHVHQPKRNVDPKGIIHGVMGKDTQDGSLTLPSEKDVKQLYEYLNNKKYH